MEKHAIKSMRSLLALTFAVMTILLIPLTVRANDDMSFKVEQIQANLPELTIYLRNDETISKDDLSAMLGERSVAIEKVERYADSNLATDYFILVDVSRSMPTSFLKPIKDALKEFVEGLRPEDKLILISFGDTVTTILEGGESKEERIAGVETLAFKDDYTHFNDAVKSVADMSDKMQDGNRKITLVMSDGIEDTTGGASSTGEATKELSERNIPLYAMGVNKKSSDVTPLDYMGELSRGLGGCLFIFDSQQASEAMKAFNGVVDSTWVIGAKTTNNLVDYKMNDLTLKYVPTGITRTKAVKLDKYVKDETAPTITKVEKTGDTTIRVEFSETVQNVDQTASWKITFNDEQNLTVTSVETVLKDNKECQSVVLTFSKELYEGDYEISAPGVTDLSMEKNPVQNKISESFDGSPVPEEEQSIYVKEKEIVREESHIWLWIILAVAVIALFLFILILWRVIKNRKGVVYVDDKAVLVSNLEKRQRVNIERVQNSVHQSQVTLEFVGNEGKKITHAFNNSMIVGRSEACDLSLTDAKLSRQHFCLEMKDGILLISDLDSTNGTRVNGLVVKKNFKLSQGDVISIGDLRMRISWKN